MQQMSGADVKPRSLCIEMRRHQSKSSRAAVSMPQWTVIVRVARRVSVKFAAVQAVGLEAAKMAAHTMQILLPGGGPSISPPTHPDTITSIIAGMSRPDLYAIIAQVSPPTQSTCHGRRFWNAAGRMLCLLLVHFHDVSWCILQAGHAFPWP